MRGVRSDWRHRLRKFASSFQVELQGNYSAQRLAALQQYARSTSSYRALLISTLSPFPCLLILTLIDVAPLAPPEAGSSANYMFWIRDFLTIALMTRAILEQFRLSVPGMQINTAQIVVMPVIASAGAIAFMLAMAGVIGFPLPFALVVGITVWFAVLVVCFACFFGRVLRQNAAVRSGLLNYIVVLVCQVLLTFIYPAYLYGFIRTGSSGQMFYVILLPVIKIVTKNWISYFLGTNFDLKPQIMIFNVDVFNALYVASSMQNSNTITTILEMIALDVVLAWISISDINRLVKGVKTLQLQIPIDHPLKSANFMEIALQLIEEVPREREQLSMRRCSSNFMAFERQLPRNPSQEAVEVARMSGRRVLPVSSAAVTLPVALPSKMYQPSSTPKDRSLQGVFTPRERRHFVRNTARVLFTTEFVILVEYTEVIVPFIFCMYTTAMFELPNHAYYPQVKALDDGSFVTRLGNVALFGVVELLSLFAIGFVIQRQLGISLVHLLAFVLDRSWRMVQSNLFLWICYTIQNSLDHNGADFSWSFSWLKREDVSTIGAA